MRPLVQAQQMEVFSMARLSTAAPSIHRLACGHVFEQESAIPKRMVFRPFWPAIGCCHQCEGVEP